MGKHLAKRKSKLFSRYGILALVGFICVVLIAVSAIFLLSRSNDPEPEPDVVMQTPELTPTPDLTPAPTPTAEPDEPEDDTPEPTPAPTPYIGPTNPLSGMPMDEEKTKNRPLAIVISNEPDALPANGVSQVDILYEYVAYIGTTRMLGIFQDFTDVNKVGSIRSARHNVIQLAESYDALFLHHGRSERARIEFLSSNVTHFDATMDYRDSDRIPGRRVASPHNAVTSSAFFERAISRSQYSNVRLLHNDGYDQGMRFTDDATPSGGNVASQVITSYSDTRTSTFVYDSSKNIYHMSMQFGRMNRDLIDANNNSKPEFSNILVIKTRITTIDSGPDRLPDFATVGSGDGYFIHGGRYIEIKWSRSSASRSSPYEYTNLDGTPLEMGRGRTFISIVSAQREVDFS